MTRGNETVGGTSIMGLMMLAAGPGTTVTVSAKGPEAQAAVDAIAALVADKFNEEGGAEASAFVAVGKALMVRSRAGASRTTKRLPFIDGERRCAAPQATA